MTPNLRLVTVKKRRPIREGFRALWDYLRSRQ